MKTIGIDMGHPINCGAKGIMSETDGNRVVGKLVINKLESAGYKVINCTYDINNNELANRVALANAQALDYFISLHMDSFNNPNSNGVTIFTTENSSAKPMAIKIINEVASSCGYYNRGWKSANYYVLKNTKAPAMLIEMGFVTNKDDCNRFNAEKISNAIVKALTGQEVMENEKYYVVTSYIPSAYDGYDGVDIKSIIDKYFKGVKCYIRGNNKGIWIETQYLSKNKCLELKESLGYLFYSIENF